MKYISSLKMEILEKASRPIIVIIIIIINKTIIIKIRTIIKIIVITANIIEIQIIRGAITTPNIIKTSIRITFLKLIINKKRKRYHNRIIKKISLQYKIILLKLRRGSQLSVNKTMKDGRMTSTIRVNSTWRCYKETLLKLYYLERKP